jgi:hypothetical protein
MPAFMLVWSTDMNVETQLRLLPAPPPQSCGLADRQTRSEGNTGMDCQWITIAGTRLYITYDAEDNSILVEVFPDGHKGTCPASVLTIYPEEGMYE